MQKSVQVLSPCVSESWEQNMHSFSPFERNLIPSNCGRIFFWCILSLVVFGFRKVKQMYTEVLRR